MYASSLNLGLSDGDNEFYFYLLILLFLIHIHVFAHGLSVRVVMHAQDLRSCFLINDIAPKVVVKPTEE